MTPGLPRRLAAMVYESVLLFAVAFFAAWLFFFASGGRDATQGSLRYALQVFIALVFAGYFLWSWLRGGQTLAMKAWKIRLVDVTPRKAVLRFFLALLLVPTGISIVSVFFHKERQFLHDRLAGTRLVNA
ncbi:MAG TPA: RDD family protein [Burkholderiales bacterium]|nr:RDD family protein [Burkholderiales bacterium]